MRFARTPLVFLSFGASLAFDVRHTRPSLLNDTGNDVEWPRSRAIVTEKQHEQKRKPSSDPIKVDSVASISSDTPAAEPCAEKNGYFFGVDGSAAWLKFSSRFQSVTSAVNDVQWSDLGSTITDFIVPDWAKVLPGYITKLQREMDMAPGSLADEVWQEAQDIDINPETTSMATVRIGNDLCLEEQAFKMRRKRYTTQALAKYLDVPENEVHPDDVPTIAMCGSGGGLRAMVAGCGSYLSAQESGLFDCVTYTAGVSGSCWLQTLYYSSIGKQNHGKIVNHLKHRIGTHIAFPPAALELLTTAPTNKFLLSGFIEKLKGHPNADFGLVDIYGMLLAARLLVPRGELFVDDSNLKLSNQRSFLANGQNPLPIYTAVRHEIPLEEHKTDAESANGNVSAATKEKAKQESWFQWFEMTPYEFFCEELDAGIPSWGTGRQYHNGKSIPLDNGLYLPEYRIPLLMGIWGSAFCATLAHYYKEIRPLVIGLAGFGGIDDLIEERNDDMTKLHPFEPASIPNYVLGLEGKLPQTCPESIFKSEHIQLADAGMSNNLPLYPLLRAGREVDILIAFDSSADIKQDNWLSVADGYARQRGIKGWPIGAGWPKQDASKEATAEELEIAKAKTPQEAVSRIAAVQEQQRKTTKNATQSPSLDQSPLPPPPPQQPPPTTDLGYCNVWVGTTLQRSSETEPPHSKIVDPDADWELLSPDAGITVVYFPLLPNPRVPGVDPATSDFLSTWNFVYSADDIDKVVALARANFEAGSDQMKRTVRAVYERKRDQRLKAEERESVRRLQGHLRGGADLFG